VSCCSQASSVDMSAAISRRVAAPYKKGAACQPL
jgi:hypothetical protein